jgi:hypothetical protein
VGTQPKRAVDTHARRGARARELPAFGLWLEEKKGKKRKRVRTSFAFFRGSLGWRDWLRRHFFFTSFLLSIGVGHQSERSRRSRRCRGSAPLLLTTDLTGDLSFDRFESRLKQEEEDDDDQ